MSHRSPCHSEQMSASCPNCCKMPAQRLAVTLLPNVELTAGLTIIAFMHSVRRCETPPRYPADPACKSFCRRDGSTVAELPNYLRAVFYGWRTRVASTLCK